MKVLHPKVIEVLHTAECGKRKAFVEKVTDEATPFRVVTTFNGRVSGMTRYYGPKEKAMAMDYADTYINA